MDGNKRATERLSAMDRYSVCDEILGLEKAMEEAIIGEDR